jgi:UPF0271 protein
VSEVFADRTYRRDGSLTPRSQAGALIEEPGLAVAQVLTMVREGKVRVAGGDTRAGASPEVTEIGILAQTVCLHGDGAHAAEFAEMIHGALAASGVEIKAPVMSARF